MYELRMEIMMSKRDDWWWFNYLFAVMVAVAILFLIGGAITAIHFVRKFW